MKTQHLGISGRRRLFAAAGILALSIAFTGCGTSGGNTPASSGNGTKTIRIAYIQKNGDQQYFIDEAAGAADLGKKLGAEVTAINVSSDANQAISQMDTVISQGYDAIAIVVPDQKIGPVVIAAAKKAGIPLVATDDTISDANGTAAPFVGFDGTSMGQKVGAEAAALFKKTDWKAANTKIIRVSKEDLQTCEDRNNGALDAFTKAAGTKLDVVKIGSDATTIDSQDKTSAALTANPGVTNWVVWGCNDESETGAVTALQNAGVSPDHIIGVGLGAYLTCKDWSAGAKSGNKAALYISGTDVGKAAVTVLVDKVKNGKALPANTIAETKIVDPTSYKAAGVPCT